MDRLPLARRLGIAPLSLVGATDPAKRIHAMVIDDALGEPRVPPSLLRPADGDRHCLAFPDEYTQPLCTRDCGIEERARKHDSVRSRPRRYHGRKLRALGAMYRQRPGEAIGLERANRNDDLAFAIVE